jgi:hypothetical protein
MTMKATATTTAKVDLVQSVETKVRALLDLPECDCGQGVACPEITLNMIDHPNEGKVRELLEMQDSCSDCLDELLGQVGQGEQDDERDDSREAEWWFLYFSDPDKPKGQRFLGAAIVEGTSALRAVRRSWALGCNPGGRADYSDPTPPHPASFRNRLLNEADIFELGFVRCGHEPGYHSPNGSR